MNKFSTIEIIFDSHRGVYIPQAFAQFCNPQKWGISEDTLRTLLNGPDTDFYWEAWDSVLNSACYTDEHGHTWTLHHDGELFALRDDYFGELIKED